MLIKSRTFGQQYKFGQNSKILVKNRKVEQRYKFLSKICPIVKMASKVNYATYEKQFQTLPVTILRLHKSVKRSVTIPVINWPSSALSAST